MKRKTNKPKPPRIRYGKPVSKRRFELTAKGKLAVWLDKAGNVW